MCNIINLSFAPLFEKAVQRYGFLCTQPNKMHKIGSNAHIFADLCNSS